METLPIEVLDKILSFVHDKDTLLSCRLVSRRWSHVTTPFLRRRVSTVKDMNQLAKMYRDFQNDRYRSLCFTKLDNKVVGAVVRLLRTCAASIMDVRVHLDMKVPLSPDNFRKFLAALDSAVLPNLRALSIEGTLEDFCAAPALSLLNLTTLRLPFQYYVKGFGGFAEALVGAAPNLKVFEAALILHSSLAEPFWPFSERFRAIPTFLLKLKVTTYGTVSEILTEISAMQQEWTNVRLTEVNLTFAVAGGQVTEVKGLIEGILVHGQGHLKALTLMPTSPDLDLDLPPLAALESLKLAWNTKGLPLRPIQGNPFRTLQSVTLVMYEEESRHFRGAVLDSVKVFRLYEPSCYVTGGAAHDFFTPWALVFPNLERFVLVNEAHFRGIRRMVYPKQILDQYQGMPLPLTTECWLDFGLVEFLLAEMRMPTLKSVAFRLGAALKRNRRVKAILPERNRRVGDVFSGFDNLKGVVKGAEAAQDGEAYWAQKEALRRPSIANLPGLQNFHFDYPIGDAFAIGVLLRMKPLDVLTICSKKLSKAVQEKVAAHHVTVRSTSPGETDANSI